MRAVLIILVCVFQITLSNAQPSIEWISSNHNMRSAVISESTNIHLVTIDSIIKYDTNGDVIFEIKYDFPGIANTTFGGFRESTLDDNGCIYGSGGYMDSITFFMYAILVKFDSFGDTIWSRKGVGQRDVVIDPNNFVYIGGPLSKLDQMGNLLWQVDSLAGIVKMDTSSNIYINSAPIDSTGNNFFGTTKYSTSGLRKWVYKFPVGNFDALTDYTIDAQGNSYLTGWQFGPNDQDYVTIKVDSSGTEQWVNIYNGPANFVDKPTSMVVDKDGNVYVTGESQQVICSAPWWCFDVATVKYDSTGAEQWVRYYNGPVNDWDRGNAIAVDDSSYIYVGVASIGNDGDNDYVIIKYDAAGNELWVERYEELGGPVLNYLALDENYNIYVAGYGPVIKYCQYGAKAGFTTDTLAVTIGDTVNFTNSSFNATWWSWDFGDGTTDTLNYNVAHSYNSTGAYTVELISWNGCGTDTTNVMVQVDSSSVGTVEAAILEAEISMYPNPTTGMLTLTNLAQPADIKVSVYNVLGKQVFSGTTFNGQINLANLPDGVYMLFAIRGKATSRMKILKF